MGVCTTVRAYNLACTAPKVKQVAFTCGLDPLAWASWGSSEWVTAGSAMFVGDADAEKKHEKAAGDCSSFPTPSLRQGLLGLSLTRSPLR